MNVIEREMQELKEIIENGRINLLPAERVAENILAAGYCKVDEREKEIEKRFENNMKAVLEIEKKQAVKEFAEKLKEKALSHCRIVNCYELTFIETEIDELLEKYEII